VLPPIPTFALSHVVIARVESSNSKRIELWHSEEIFGKGVTLLKTISSLAPLILRITLGAIFLMHGITAFEKIGNMAQLFAKIGVPYASYTAPALAVLEIVGGACLILGIGTRIFALLLAAVMGVAIFKVKFSQGFQNYQFELLLLVSLFSLVLSGGGALALTRRRERRGVPKQDFPRRAQVQ